MFKRIGLIVFVCVLVFSFSSCKSKEKFNDEEVLFDITDVKAGEVLTPSENNGEEIPESQQEENKGEDKKDEKPSADSSNSLDLVEAPGYYFPNIKELYEPAARIYYEITSGNLPVDWDLGRFEFNVDGSVNTYWRISDSRFDSKAELENYLDAYFTQDFIKTFYKPELFYDYEEHLYAVTGISGENPLFAGYEFKLTKQTTKRIMFDCVSYYYKSLEEIPENKEEFFGTPKNTEIYSSNTVSFVLEVDESGYNWKFSKFDNIK